MQSRGYIKKHITTSPVWGIVLIFFKKVQRSGGWSPHPEIVLEHCPLTRIDGRLMLAADGIKISKEAERGPGSNGCTRNRTTREKLHTSMGTIGA